MVRRSLREEGSCILDDFHGHGRPWKLGGAAARGKKKGREWVKWRNEWRVKKMRRKKRRVAGQGGFIEGGSGGSPSFDWPRWVAGLGKRDLTQAEFICGIGKGQRRRGFPRWSNYGRERERHGET